MKPLTLSADPALQKVVKFHDLNDGRFAVDTVYDVQDIVDHAQRIRNAQKADWKGENMVASIPMPLFMELRKQGIVQDKAAFKRWLNNPDNALFRTKAGKV